MPRSKKKAPKKKNDPYVRDSEGKVIPWYKQARVSGPNPQWRSPGSNPAADAESRRKKNYVISLIPESIKNAVRKYNEKTDDLLLDYYKEAIKLWCEDNAPYYQFVEEGDQIRIDILRIPPSR